MFYQFFKKSKYLVYLIVFLCVFCLDIIFLNGKQISSEYINHEEYNYYNKSTNDFNEIVAETAGGIMIGSLTGFGFACLSGGKSNSVLFESGPNIQLINAALGAILGGSIGVYAVGNLTGERGVFLNTLIYSLVIGGSIQVVSYSLYYGNLKNSSEVPNPSVIEMLGIIAPVAGALIGYNNSRKSKNSTGSLNGVLNIKGRKTSVEFPCIYSEKRIETCFSGIKLINVEL